MLYMFLHLKRYTAFRFSVLYMSMLVHFHLRWGPVQFNLVHNQSFLSVWLNEYWELNYQIPLVVYSKCH